MNIISFTSFDNFNAPKSPSPEVEKDQKPEDFSAILSNVSNALQRESSPQVNFAPRGENVVSTAQTVSETNYNFVTVKDENPVEKNYFENQNSLPINSVVNPNVPNIQVLGGSERLQQPLTITPQINQVFRGSLFSETKSDNVLNAFDQTQFVQTEGLINKQTTNLGQEKNPLNPANDLISQTIRGNNPLNLAQNNLLNLAQNNLQVKVEPSANKSSNLPIKQSEITFAPEKLPNVKKNESEANIEPIAQLINVVNYQSEIKLPNPQETKSTGQTPAPVGNDSAINIETANVPSLLKTVSNKLSKVKESLLNLQDILPNLPRKSVTNSLNMEGISQDSEAKSVAADNFPKLEKLAVNLVAEPQQTNDLPNLPRKSVTNSLNMEGISQDSEAKSVAADNFPTLAVPAVDLVAEPRQTKDFYQQTNNFTPLKDVSDNSAAKIELGNNLPNLQTISNDLITNSGQKGDTNPIFSKLSNLFTSAVWKNDVKTKTDPKAEAAILSQPDTASVQTISGIISGVGSTQKVQITPPPPAGAVQSEVSDTNFEVLNAAKDAKIPEYLDPALQITKPNLENIEATSIDSKLVPELTGSIAAPKPVNDRPTGNKTTLSEISSVLSNVAETKPVNVKSPQTKSVDPENSPTDTASAQIISRTISDVKSTQNLQAVPPPPAGAVQSEVSITNFEVLNTAKDAKIPEYLDPALQITKPNLENIEATSIDSKLVPELTGSIAAPKPVNDRPTGNKTTLSEISSVLANAAKTEPVNEVSSLKSRKNESVRPENSPLVQTESSKSFVTETVPSLSPIKSVPKGETLNVQSEPKGEILNVQSEPKGETLNIQSEPKGETLNIQSDNLVTNDKYLNIPPTKSVNEIELANNLQTKLVNGDMSLIDSPKFVVDEKVLSGSPKKPANKDESPDISPIKNKIIDALPTTAVVNADLNNSVSNQTPTIISDQSVSSGELLKIVNPEVRENPGMLGKDKPEIKTNEDTSDFDSRFDNFLGTISKRQDVTAAAATKNEVELSKLAEQINPHLLELAALAIRKNEKQSLNIRLHPAELGMVEIKLERNSSGVLNAHFYTETEGAKQTLTNSLEQLRNSLQNAGIQVGELEITNGSSSANPNQQHRENNQRQSESVKSSAFSQGSDNPDESEQTSSSSSSSRLLSLLA